MKTSEGKGSACCGPDCCGGTGEALKAGDKVKQAVREHYAAVAEQSADSGCGCGVACCADGVSMSEDYRGVAGYAPEADLGLGCGLPAEAADLREGEIVVDLGSGAGNDAFVARALVGGAGRVIGVDMTEAMVERANRNRARLGHANVEFRLGDIEDLPLRDNLADAVISNCVLNLVPDKAAAFAEAFRVLKPGGRLAVSDIVLTGGPLPEALREAAEVYAGCVGGAMQRDAYLSALREAGFAGARIVTEKEIRIPGEMIERYLGPEEAETLRRSGFRILSVTVRAEKPA